MTLLFDKTHWSYYVNEHASISSHLGTKVENYPEATYGHIIVCSNIVHLSITKCSTSHHTAVTINAYITEFDNCMINFSPNIN